MSYDPPIPDFDTIQVAQPLQVPHSREAEEATIGTVLINQFMYWEISRVIKANDFYIHRNKYIWEAFERLSQANTPIDLVTVSDELGKVGLLEDVGGSGYITSLIGQVPSSLNAMAYAYIVKGASERRKGIQFANSIAHAAYDEATPFTLRDHAVRVVQTDGVQNNRVTAKQAASRAIDAMISNPRFCKFGISNQDKAIGGIFGDELSILAGYQGTGKSALAIHSMRKNAKDGKVVMAVSLEMTAAQIWMRMACGDLEIDMNHIRNGDASADTRGKVSIYAAELAEKYEGKIIIYESPMSPMDILSASMLEQPDIVFIDHLDLIEGRPPRDSKMDWYNFCTRFLRQNVAKGENHIPVMLLHQLSRGASREKRRPTKHDLAYAGENDSDSIYLLHRPDEDNDADKVQSSRIADIEIITAKSRFGWTGTQMARFHLSKQQFFPPYNFEDEEPVDINRIDIHGDD